MDVKIVRRGEIWQYNPALEGYSDGDVFLTLSGTPAISSSKLRLNADSIMTINRQFQFGSVEFFITVPVEPTAGDVREFGFKNNGDNGKMTFKITDTDFTAEVYDTSGTAIASKTIEWDSSWTATEARYRISWDERNVYFAIDDTIVARIENGYDKDIVSTDQTMKMPCAIYLNNANSDNMDVSLINYA